MNGDTSTSTNTYTQDSNEACTGYNSDGPDLVYAFTPVADGSYTFLLTPTTADLGIYVLDSCPTGPIAACVGGTDEGGSGDSERLVLNLTGGVTYNVFVDGYNANAGTFSLVAGPTPPPPADTCEDTVTDLQLNAVNFGDTTGMTDNFSLTSASCADISYSTSGVGSPDVVYAFTAPTAGSYDITVNADFDAISYIIDAPCTDASPATCVAGVESDDDSGRMRVNLAAQTYYIVVDGYSASSDGSYSIVVKPTPPPPANDSCTSSSIPALDVGVAVSGDTTEAADDFSIDDDTCSYQGSGGKDVVYAFTPPTAGSYDITVDAPDFDAVSYILDSATCTNASPSACVTGVESDEESSTMRATLAAQTYYIVVDSYSSYSQGTFSIVVNPSPPPPTNDSCTSSSIPALDVGVAVSGDTSQATDDFSIDDSSCSYQGTGGQDVVYAFTPPTDGSYDITVDATFDAVSYILDSATCTNASPSACSTGVESDEEASTMRAALTGQTTYYIVVDGYSTNSKGTFTIDVEQAPPPPANDTCAGAVALSVGTTATGDTNSAVNDYTTLGGGACYAYSNNHGAANDVVYSFTPAGDGQYTFTLTSTDGNLTDYMISVVDSCPSAPIDTCVAGAEDYGDVSFAVSLTGGTPYFVIVDGYGSSDNGAFTLDVTGP